MNRTAGAIMFFLFVLIIILGIVFRNKISEIYESFRTKKTTEQCPDDQEKNNETYFSEKIRELAGELKDPSLFIFTSFVLVKLYHTSDYNNKMDEFLSSIENKNETKKAMEKSYDTIIKELGPPTCILTQTQLTACKEVLDDF